MSQPLCIHTYPPYNCTSIYIYIFIPLHSRTCIPIYIGISLHYRFMLHKYIHRMVNALHYVYIYIYIYVPACRNDVADAAGIARRGRRARIPGEDGRGPAWGASPGDPQSGLRVGLRAPCGAYVTTYWYLNVLSMCRNNTSNVSLYKYIYTYTHTCIHANRLIC